MTSKQRPATFLRGAVGLAMRLYRESPFYPRLGRSLGRLLAMLPRSPDPVLVEIDGVTFELDLREVIDSSLYYSGTFEAGAERVITSLLQPGMLAIDIGANIGYHTFRMAKAVGDTGCVWAIEPTAWGMRKLHRNCALNAFVNIQLLKVGLSDVDRSLAHAPGRRRQSRADRQLAWNGLPLRNGRSQAGRRCGCALRGYSGSVFDQLARAPGLRVTEHSRVSSGGRPRRLTPSGRSSTI
jgi:hypothetical protein